MHSVVWIILFYLNCHYLIRPWPWTKLLQICQFFFMWLCFVFTFVFAFKASGTNGRVNEWKVSWETKWSYSKIFLAGGYILGLFCVCFCLCDGYIAHPSVHCIGWVAQFSLFHLSGTGNIKSKLRSTILSIIQIIYFLIVYHTGNFFTMLASYDHIFIISIFKKNSTTSTK